jgi:hypothetical protein
MITTEQVGERYLAVHHRMFRAVTDAMSGCGLSMARTKVLLRLREQSPVRQNALAADFGLSPRRRVLSRPRRRVHGCIPVSTQRWNASTWAAGQAPSQGMEPSRSRGRMSAA